LRFSASHIRPHRQRPAAARRLTTLAREWGHLVRRPSCLDDAGHSARRYASAASSVISGDPPTRTTPMKAITLKLPDTLDHRLTHFARHQMRGSKSAVVRQAIEAYLNAAPPSAEPSAAVMAAKWVGVLKGPKDLSTHPKHLDDFGR
jgi:hypothetical protein